MFSTLPIIGGSSFCASTVTGTGGLSGITGTGQGTLGSICGQTVPAGPPALTGSEIIPADYPGGAGPTQTVGIPTALLSYPNAINRLVGGDFNTNLWQRGTTPVSAATPSTAVMGADRWYAYSSTNTVTVSKQTAAADQQPSLGFYAAQRVSRPSTTTTTQICVGQVLDKQASAPLLGNNAVFSFWALASASFASISNGNLQVNVAYYTAADSATPGTNTGTFAAGTIAGYTAAIAGPSAGTTVASVTNGVAQVPISTTWTRYSVYAPIPTVNASGTAVTGVGVSLCYTPTSGTGASTEWFEFNGAQLQAMPADFAPGFTNAPPGNAQFPNGVISPTAFERRTPAVESLLQYYYSYGIQEANGTIFASGACSATNVDSIPLRFPVPMRTAPTAGTATFTAGGFQVIINGAAGAGISGTTLVTPTASDLSLKFTNACTAGQTVLLTGTGTTGLLLVSAEP
jgi:hypothetical protein